MTDHIPTPHELPHKPLLEAIFELRWGLQQKSTGEEMDPGFQILLGRFYDRVSADFPEVENLPSSTVPEAIVPNVVRHRLRKVQNGWPLLQLGPGVLSVNDTEGYTWKTFRPMIRQAVEALHQAYPRKIAPLDFVQATLRYVDAVPLNALGEGKGVLDFLKEHLHTDISIDPLLFDDPAVVTNPVGFQVRFNYPLNKPKGLGVLSFATGMRENVPSIVWENMVVSRETHVPGTLEAFDEWFEDAHTVTDRWFFTLCRGELLNSFGGRNDA